eukprot:6782165-Prorocentrum_lima.AAC.1
MSALREQVSFRIKHQQEGHQHPGGLRAKGLPCRLHDSRHAGVLAGERPPVTRAQSCGLASNTLQAA